jgi:Holliday junction resolvase-like predicted endonuclease
MAALLEVNGYQCTLNATLKGKCVNHEVDIIAKKGEEIIFAECKFHNNPASKNDLKTVLYVNARALDLKDNPENKMTHFWLISNTKFSSDAITYSNCANLYLLGPNHPVKNAISDMVKKASIHPITCLTRLTHKQTRALLDQNIFLCRHIKEKPEVLNGLGLDEIGINNIIYDVNHLCAGKEYR